MTWLTWCLLLGGVLLNATAQLLLKAATRRSGELVADSGRVSWVAVTHLLGAVPLWVGLACYGVSVVVWLGALSRVPVSVAYPMLSIGYVVNAFAAALLFGEALSLGKLAGIGMICAGVITLARLQHS
jgi:multidrug transporter EmrE-like cation transporter